MSELLTSFSHAAIPDNLQYCRIRSHNRKALEEHPMFNRITLLEGSSTDEAIIRQIHEHIEGKKSVLVTLDSNHTHEHVLHELELYSPFVTVGSYLVVYDTAIEDVDDELFSNRPGRQSATQKRLSMNSCNQRMILKSTPLSPKKRLSLLLPKVSCGASIIIGMSNPHYHSALLRKLRIVVTNFAHAGSCSVSR